MALMAHCNKVGVQFNADYSIPARCKIIKIAARATSDVQYVGTRRQKIVKSFWQVKSMALVLRFVASRVVAVRVDRDEDWINVALLCHSVMFSYPVDACLLHLAQQ